MSKLPTIREPAGGLPLEPTNPSDLVSHLLTPIAGQIPGFKLDLGISGLLESVDNTREALHRSLGPLDELRHSSVFALASQLTGTLQHVAGSAAKFLDGIPLLREANAAVSVLSSVEIPGAARHLTDELNRVGSSLAELGRPFALPEPPQVVPLFATPELLPPLAETVFTPKGVDEFQHSVPHGTLAWLEPDTGAHSITGVHDLRELGRALDFSQAVGSETPDRGQQNLGDWRDPNGWPSSIFTDPVARGSFYREWGLDSALSDFRPPAFDEGARIAGLELDLPSLTPTYRPETEEDGLARTNAAHDRLQRFETGLRRFIDEAMKAEFGKGWIKRQVPGDIRSDWIRKQQRDRDDGTFEYPLFAYADFTDYVSIITRRDNWKRIFAPVFRRQTLVQESFQRLYPIRRHTMHARIITPDDEVDLYIETKRLLSAMGISI